VKLIIAIVFIVQCDCVVYAENKSDERNAGVAVNGSCKKPAQLIPRDNENIFTCCGSSELDSNASRLELMRDSSVGVSLAPPPTYVRFFHNKLISR